MNPATKAPNFTRENAAEMARRANASRRANKIARLAQAEAERKAALEALPADEEARKRRTLKQIDMLDTMIDKALNLGHQDKFLKLSAAKERLWRLVQPTAGVLRPRPSKQRAPVPVPISSPLAGGSGLTGGD